MFDGVEARVLCRPVKFFHTDLDKPFLYGPCFVHRGIVMLKQKKAFSNCCHKVGIVLHVIVCCSVKIYLHWN